MEKTQLLLTDFIHQDKTMLYDAKQIYLPDEKKSLITKINEFNQIANENKQLKKEINILQDRLAILENKLITSTAIDLPSWADATPAQISSILTQYYNNEITIDEIPWHIGDKKYITYEEDIEDKIATKYFILTILDKNKFSNAFVIGLQCKGSPTHSEYSSHISSLDLLAGVRSFPSYISYYTNWELFEWKYSSSQKWLPSNYNDEQTISIFQTYYNSQDLNSILALAHPNTFNDICDTQRTLIPCPKQCMCIGENMLQFFKNHLQDYPLLSNYELNSTMGYNSIYGYENKAYDFLGYFTPSNDYYGCMLPNCASYSLLLFCL